MVHAMVARLAGCVAVAGVVCGLLGAVSTIKAPSNHQVFKTAGLWNPLSSQSFTRQ